MTTTTTTTGTGKARAAAALTDGQQAALDALASPEALDGDAPAEAAFAMRPGGGTALHRAVSTQLGRIGRKDLLSSPPMAALRAVKAGHAQALSPADLRALRAFAAAFPDSGAGMLLLGARFLSDSIARHRARTAGTV